MTYRAIEAGLLIRRQVRNVLEQAKFLSFRIRWLEQKGFLSSKFFIEGPDLDKLNTLLPAEAFHETENGNA